MRVHAFAVFVGAWDPALQREDGVVRGPGLLLLLSGDPTTDPDHYVVGLCGAKNQDVW